MSIGTGIAIACSVLGTLGVITTLILKLRIDHFPRSVCEHEFETIRKKTDMLDNKREKGEKAIVRLEANTEAILKELSRLTILIEKRKMGQ